MSPFLWETHLHTRETSRCGRASAAALVAAYHKAGYHGLVITDHFLSGSNSAPADAPWQDRVDWMARGFHAAKAAGDALGIAVLCGCEFSHHGADYLTYGVGEPFWRDHPGLDKLDADSYVRLVHDAGGFVAQAHPFRQAWYMPPDVAQRWDLVDGIEIINGSHTLSERPWDTRALALAQAHGLVQMAGSDAHSLTDVGTAALAFDEPFTDEADFLAALRAGLGKPLRRRDVSDKN